MAQTSTHIHKHARTHTHTHTHTHPKRNIDTETTELLGDDGDRGRCWAAHIQSAAVKETEGSYTTMELNEKFKGQP